MNKKLSENIAYYRKSMSISQEELGLKIGRTKFVISDYEIGRTEPDIDTLIALADVFDVTLDELVGRKTKNLIV